MATEFTMVGGYIAEVIGDGYAIRVRGLDIFVNDSAHTDSQAELTDEEKKARRLRVLAKARTAVRKAKR